MESLTFDFQHGRVPTALTFSFFLAFQVLLMTFTTLNYVIFIRRLKQVLLALAERSRYLIEPITPSVLRVTGLRYVIGRR